MMKKEQDLTTGNIPGKLILFALPLLFANLLQSFYSVVDMLVVGRFTGETGLAAISNASMLSFIINSVCIGVTMGGTVLIAQYKGAKDEKGQVEIIHTLWLVTWIAAVIITLIGLSIYEPLFRAMKVPLSVMQDACDYMEIICCGTVFVFGYNAVCSIIKGYGDAKGPLLFVAAATVVNIIADIILIGNLGMGTKGAAYATILSQGLSFLLSVIYLKRKKFVCAVKRERFSFRTDMLVKLLNIGVPAAIQMVVVNISYLLITGMLNNFGVSVAAASGVGLKVNTFAGMPCQALGLAVTIMTGQNMGADDTRRVRKVTKTGLFLNVFITFWVVISVQVFAEPIITLFHPEGSKVIEEGVLYLRICCGANSLIYAAMYTFDSFAIGIGSANVAMINAVLDAMIIRLPVCWLLAFSFGAGFPGIYIGQAISPVLPAIIGFLYYKCKKWEKKRIVKISDYDNFTGKNEV